MLQPRVFKGLRTIHGYPDSLETLGDHIRAARLDRNELQKDVADLIGVAVETILHWELHQTEVSTPHYPKIMAYLGYCLIPKSIGRPSLGTLVHRHRIHRGLNLRQAAKLIGVDPGALSKWECGASKPLAKSVAKLTRFIRAAGK